MNKNRKETKMKTLDQITQEGKERFDEQFLGFFNESPLEGQSLAQAEAYAFLSSFAREVAEGALESVKLGELEDWDFLSEAIPRMRLGHDLAREYVASRAKAFLNE